MILRNKTILFIIGIFFISLSGCYSFTGSSLDPSIKTIEIKSFPNYSAYQSPNLSVDFTTALQNRFNQRTKLVETNVDPDIILEGEITNFSTSPINIQSNSDEATQNRLTITVSVRYENKKQPEKSFDKTFSDYEDYSSKELLIDVQDDLAQKINQRIIDQIFLAIVADW
ncbi:LptE family protein [uncultured Apibacter sp.]|uniref:LptE family protein n=1 Tax=uncultured Apibacter sp. TaxID=1778616 RepID=UPI0025DD25BC|nr:LptE family protein [uncultured Apibacter sp.]